MKRPLRYGLSTTVLHFFVQFYGWSLAPGNAARPGVSIPWAWPILSFPIFYVVPASTATGSFWLVCFANSATWGGVAFIVALALERRGRAPGTP